MIYIIQLDVEMSDAAVAILLDFLKAFASMTHVRNGITNIKGNERRKHDGDRRILTNENHPTRSQMINRIIYDDYAMKPGSPKLFFLRAAEPLGQMDIDGRRKVEKTPDYIRSPWYTDDGKSMDCLCEMRKGTPNEIFRAKFQELLNEKFNDHTRIYTDGSKKEEKIRYAVITDK
jgi:hypothetical protein